MSRRHPGLALSLGVFGLLLAGAAPAQAEDPPAEKPTVRKTKEQLHFELPPDWPVEKRNGIVGPIPVEEYLAKKFKAVEVQLQAIEQKLNGLDLRMRVLEEAAKSKAPQQGLRSTGQAQP
jgi:hypothetical protein